MSSTFRPILLLLFCLSLTALACSLPGRLLRSAASEAVEDLQAAPDVLGAPDDDSTGAIDEPGTGVEGLPGVQSSPAYDIYVGANVTGNCGASTNSGGFAWLTFDSVFRGIRFLRPSEDNLPGPYGGMAQEGGVPFVAPGMGLIGEGTLGEFTFCPMYEPEVHPCTVTAGPSPFGPSLSLGVSDSDTPVVPLDGTPAAAGGGEAFVTYSIGGTSEMQSILLWDCEIGTGALGGALSPALAGFSTSWDRLMLGEEFSLGAIGGDEGETWEWTIRFVPVE